MKEQLRVRLRLFQLVHLFKSWEIYFNRAEERGPRPNLDRYSKMYCFAVYVLRELSCAELA